MSALDFISEERFRTLWGVPMAVFTERGPRPCDAGDESTDLVKRVVDAGRLDRPKAVSELTGISLSPSIPFRMYRFEFQLIEILVYAFGRNNTTFSAMDTRLGPQKLKDVRAGFVGKGDTMDGTDAAKRDFFSRFLPKKRMSSPQTT
jgi:hypothetical protein